MIRPRHLNHRNTVIALIVVVVVIVAGLALLLDQVTSSATPNSPTPSVTPGSISIEGTVVCLPHKGDGPHTLECAFGLHGNDGNYYGLRGLDQDQLINGTPSVHSRVAVKGDIAAPPENEKYDIVGYIDITTIDIITVAN